jgi:hypothetical protein
LQESTFPKAAKYREELVPCTVLDQGVVELLKSTFTRANHVEDLEKVGIGDGGVKLSNVEGS